VTGEPVADFGCALGGHPEALNATYFSRSGIAFHYYPSVPDHPASHGCVRLKKESSEIIYDNARKGLTKVTVGGTWKRGMIGKKPVCW
jgi:lipoprotein-anchoring transpeptidase ErfK/SrfK